MGFLRTFLLSGLHKNYSYNKNRRVKFLNLVLLMFLCTLVCLIAYNAVVLQYRVLAGIEAGLIPVVIGLHWLNRKGRNELALILLFVILHSFLLFVSMHLHIGHGTEYLHLVLILMLMLFYTEGWYVYIMYAFNLAMVYAPQIVYHPYPAENYSWTNPVILFISFLTLIRLYVMEQKKLGQRITKRNAELQIINNEKNALLGVAAHDLRSPLQRIEGLLTVLKMDEGSFTSQHLELIDSAIFIASNQHETIQQILNISAVEENCRNLTMSKVNAYDVIRELVRSFEILSAKKNINFMIKSRPEDVFIEGHRESLNHVFENIISNAIKFSPKGSTVSIDFKVEDDNVQIQISDEGPGFRREDKNYVFQTFRKLSARPTDNESSSGLGLSIAKRYVDAMNGKIWYESEYGSGATFIVQLNKLQS